MFYFLGIIKTNRYNRYITSAQTICTILVIERIFFNQAIKRPLITLLSRVERKRIP